MSGWQLGLALLGCFLLGAVAAVTLTYLWAKRLWNQAQGKLAGQLLGLSTASTTSSGGEGTSP